MRSIPPRRPQMTRQGFTLLELMVVVVLVAILAVVAVASFSKYQRNARRGEGLALMNDIRMKQETFFNTYSRYVSAPDATDENAWSGQKMTGELLGYYKWDEECPDNDNGWCILGFRPTGINVDGEEDLLHFQLQTIGWGPGVPAPSFIENDNERWWSVQARGLPDNNGAFCTRMILHNEVNEAIVLGEETDCP